MLVFVGFSLDILGKHTIKRQSIDFQILSKNEAKAYIKPYIQNIWHAQLFCPENLVF